MMLDYKNFFENLIETALKKEASDIHLVPGYYPIIRISGSLVPLLKEKVLSPEDSKQLAYLLMTEEQRKRFEKEKEIDFSFEIRGRVRLRANVFYQKDGISTALRLLPEKIKTIEELNLPPILHMFTKAHQGFVLICGPSSHGKSTTLAALIDEINKTRREHIITIEDPIEYVFKPDKSIIEQREINTHTLSFAKALKSALREDPDVIMIGEMRDPETMAIAITAAETGHLVFATLHTNSAAQTIHRIVDSFPAEQQSQIRAQLSGSLLGIVSQRLVPRIEGGLIPACEIMIMTPAIGNLIRENRIHEIQNIIDTSVEIGMISLNRSLAELVRKREIFPETALNYSLNPNELKLILGI